MQGILEQKKKFLESIHVDINNIPVELLQINQSMEQVLSSEDIEFLNRESLTGTYTKEFSLKNLVGTIHPNYFNKTWLENFLATKRGDDIVEKYFKNPNYYDKYLKQFEQLDVIHDTPIELYEDDDKFLIKGGNNRLSLIMLKYFAEKSKAKTNEDKERVDTKYTFVGQVNPIPKDKKIMYMINMLRDRYGSNIKINRTAKIQDDCKYEIKINNKLVNINSKEELTEYLKQSYQLVEFEKKENLQKRIANIIQDEIRYSSRNDENKVNIIKEFIPNYDEFKKIYFDIRENGLEDKLFENIDFKDVNFDNLLQKANIIIKQNINNLNISEKKQEEIKQKPITDLIGNDQSQKIYDGQEKAIINECGEIIRRKSTRSKANVQCEKILQENN